MSRFTSGHRTATGWAIWVATLLILGGCGGEAPTGPVSAPLSTPALSSASTPFHDHHFDAGFSGVVPCAEVGINIHATYDYDITVSVSFFPNRNVFRTHTTELVLTLQNVETGETLIERGTSTETIDFDTGTLTQLLSTTFRNAEGRIILKTHGRLVFDADGNLIFEAGQHPQFEPDFLTAVCTELS
jgi:hypothetical protein